MSEGSDCTPSRMSYRLACRDLSLSSLCSSRLHILAVREAFPRTSTPSWNEHGPMMSSAHLKQRDEASGGAASSFSAGVLAGTDPAAGGPNTLTQYPSPSRPSAHPSKYLLTRVSTVVSLLMDQIHLTAAGPSLCRQRNVE